MDNNDKKVRNIIVVLLAIVSILMFSLDGFEVYGIMTVFGGLLYLLWNGESKDNNDDDDNDNYYGFKKYTFTL